MISLSETEAWCWFISWMLGWGIAFWQSSKAHKLKMEKMYREMRESNERLLNSYMEELKNATQIRS